MDFQKTVLQQLASFKNEFEKVHEKFNGLDVRFDGMDSRLDKVDTRLDGIDTRLDGMDSRFDGMDTRLDGMDSRLNGMDARLDGNGTCIEGLTEQVVGLSERFTLMEDTQNRMASVLIDVKSDLSNVNVQLGRHETLLVGITDTVDTFVAEQRKSDSEITALHSRIGRCEKKLNLHAV